MYDDIIEARLTNGEVRDKLREMYEAGDKDAAALLREQPETAYDYICRYTYWAQAMAGRYDSPTQYAIMQQLVRAYAVHAVLIGDLVTKVPTAKLEDIQRSLMAALRAHPMPEAV